MPPPPALNRVNAPESDKNATTQIINSLKPTIPVYCTCAMQREFIQRVSRFCGFAGYMGCHAVFLLCLFLSPSRIDFALGP